MVKKKRFRTLEVTHWKSQLSPSVFVCPDSSPRFVWTCLYSPSSPRLSSVTGTASSRPGLRSDLVTRYWRLKRGWRPTLWSRAEAFSPFTIILSGEMSRPQARERRVEDKLRCTFHPLTVCAMSDSCVSPSSLRCCVFSSWEIHTDCSQSDSASPDPSLRSPGGIRALCPAGLCPRRGM